MRRLIVLGLVAGTLVLPAAARAGNAAVEVTAEPASATSASGCRTADIARVGKDIFGFVVYKFHHVKRWCWSFPRITSVSTSTYISHVDPNMDYAGIVAATGRFYTWCCGSSRSGHYSFRQAKFRNCILWFPCSRTEYPWVKIWAHGDGSYAWATGL